MASKKEKIKQIIEKQVIIKDANFKIKCPSCSLPFFQIYSDGRQSYLKWFGGKFVEVFCKGIFEVHCPICKSKIEIISQIIQRFDTNL